MGTFDLHVHSDASPDSILSLEKLVAACRRRGLSGVAVTDHNRVAGALALAAERRPDLLVIVGEEVLTAQGELLGLYLQEEVASGRPAAETARAIRAQGGLVGASHPCDSWRQVLAPPALEELCQAGLLDFLEGRNGRTLRPGDNRRAEELGRRLGLPLSAGSDAHSPWEVGACCVELPPFSGRQGFLAALQEGQLQGRTTAPWMQLGSTMARLRRLWPCASGDRRPLP